MNVSSFFSSKQAPRDVAKDRLKLILIHDRTDLSPEFLEMIKEDIMKVISKYAEIDCKDVDVRMTKTSIEEGEEPALIASIPIKAKNR
ncbi:MAG: cell division topological specificity factor MinE [Clostridiaceae bacterium]